MESTTLRLLQRGLKVVVLSYGILVHTASCHGHQQPVTMPLAWSEEQQSTESWDRVAPALGRGFNPVQSLRMGRDSGTSDTEASSAITPQPWLMAEAAVTSSAIDWNIPEALRKTLKLLDGKAKVGGTFAGGQESRQTIIPDNMEDVARLLDEATAADIANTPFGSIARVNLGLSAKAIRRIEMTFGLRGDGVGYQDTRIELRVRELSSETKKKLEGAGFLPVKENDGDIYYVDLAWNPRAGLHAYGVVLDGKAHSGPYIKWFEGIGIEGTTTIQDKEVRVVLGEPDRYGSRVLKMDPLELAKGQVKDDSGNILCILDSPATLKLSGVAFKRGKLIPREFELNVAGEGLGARFPGDDAHYRGKIRVISGKFFANQGAERITETRGSDGPLFVVQTMKERNEWSEAKPLLPTPPYSPSNQGSESPAPIQSSAGAASALPYQRDARGFNEVRVRNPNEYTVTVMLRTGDSGLDFKVPPRSAKSAYVGTGRYDIYFVYSNDPSALYQGDSFTLNETYIELRLIGVSDGNYNVRRVK